MTQTAVRRVGSCVGGFSTLPVALGVPSSESPGVVLPFGVVPASGLCPSSGVVAWKGGLVVTLSIVGYWGASASARAPDVAGRPVLFRAGGPSKRRHVSSPAEPRFAEVPHSDCRLPMNILLTGAAGFIGARVAEFLLDAGHRSWASTTSTTPTTYA